MEKTICGTSTDNFQKLIKECDLQPYQIYNCGETGLNYKMLPSSTLASKKSKAPDYIHNQEQVTILACSNAFGIHKLPFPFAIEIKKGHG